MSMPHDATRHTQPYSLPASASRKGTAFVCFNAFIQTRSAQLACPLAWTTSVPDLLPIMDPIYLYNVHSVAPSLGGQATLVLNPTG